MHFDGRNLTNDDPNDTRDTWQATRVRPFIEGTVGGIYDFRFMPDFGQGRTVIQNAYVTGRFTPSFQVTAGRFKAPVGLERLQESNAAKRSRRSSPASPSDSERSDRIPFRRPTDGSSAGTCGKLARWSPADA